MNKLSKEQIINLLPHREPMLLIDKLTNIVHLKSATAIMYVKKNSFYVQGHFPDQPVMPGVLIVEAFGQAAAALTAHGIDPKEYANKIVFLVAPGDFYREYANSDTAHFYLNNSQFFLPGITEAVSFVSTKFFSIKKTKSETGVMSEIARKLSKNNRTWHPVYSFAILGNVPKDQILNCQEGG